MGCIFGIYLYNPGLMADYYPILYKLLASREVQFLRKISAKRLILPAMTVGLVLTYQLIKLVRLINSEQKPVVVNQGDSFNLSVLGTTDEIIEPTAVPTAKYLGLRLKPTPTVMSTPQPTATPTSAPGPTTTPMPDPTATPTQTPNPAATPTPSFKSDSDIGPTLTPEPTKTICQPRPACLDVEPPCEIKEPIGGWCDRNQING